MSVFWRPWIPVLVYYLLISYLSSRSHFPVSLPRPDFDKVIHLLEYIPVGLLICHAVLRTLPTRPKLAASLSVFIALSLGALDEWHQSAVPGRDANVYDWLADAMGVLIGAGLYRFINRIRRIRKTRLPLRAPQKGSLP